MISIPDLAITGLVYAANSNTVGAVLALTLWTAFRFAQGISPRLRYFIAVAAFLTVLVLPALSAFEFLPVRQSAVLAIREPVDLEPRQPSNQYFAPNVLVETPASSPSVSDEAGAIKASPLLLSAFFAVWLIGATMLLSREIAGHVILIRARRSWRRADIEICERLGVPTDTRLYIGNGEGPFAIGVIKPVVVVPDRLLTELPTDAVRRIVGHELDHVKWRDPAINAALRLLRALTWIVFPLWLIERVVRLEREAAADHAAVKPHDTASTAEYANAMVALVNWSTRAPNTRRFRFVTTGIDVQPGLEKRVRRLFQAAPLCVRRLAFAASVLAIGIVSTFFLPGVVSATKSPSFALVIAVADNDEAGSQTAIERFLSTNRSIHATGDSVANPALTSDSEPITTESGDAESADIIPVEIPIPITSSASTFAADLTEDQFIAIQKYKVTPEFVAEMAAVGYPDLSIDRLIDFRRVGVSAAFVGEMANAGYQSLSPDLLIDYRRHGVSISYINEMRRYGYSGLSPQNLIDFRRQAVSAAYITEIAELGYGNLSANTILEFRHQGVSAAFITDISDVVNRPPTARELIDMRKLAVTTAFVAELKRLDYDEVTAGELIALKANGVTAAFVEKMNTRNASSHSLRELISMRAGGER